ncbi:MAG TPA: DUF1996 domain-containing protein [Actinomycetota bacterium]|nr:DUF1996 domain-containing protein [Actinomycetota bacterium]
MRAFRLMLTLAVLLALGGVFAIDRARAGTSEFIVRCFRFDHALPDDPIVFPGEPGASHLHTFTGNRTTDADSTFRSMVGRGTTCELAQDTSAYWVPALVDRDGRWIQARQIKVYYRGSGVTPFPRDLRMIAGYPTVPVGTDKVVGWSCGAPTTLEPSPPNCGSGDVYAHIFFPSCWDGTRTDSRDHRSHVVYPSPMPNGPRCPADHPVRLPMIRLSIHYDVSSGEGLRLSSDRMSGTAPGGSLHADFWNTWVQSALRRLVEVCLNQGQPCGEVTQVP